MFPDDDPSEIEYSIICLIQAGLLDVGVFEKKTTLAGRTDYIIGSLAGLTQSGGEYVRHSAKYYGKAVKILQNLGDEITTQSVKDTVRYLLQMGIELAAKSLANDGLRATTTYSMPIRASICCGLLRQVPNSK